MWTVTVTSATMLFGNNSINDKSFVFEASDVPVDPVEQLIDSLHAAIHGQSSKVWWHLEPDGYYVELDSMKGEYTITISFAEGSKIQSRRQLCSLRGDFSDIILPLWRALREFYSHQYTDPHWPSEPILAMLKLTNEVKMMK